MFFRNVGLFLTGYTASHPGRPYFSLLTQAELPASDLKGQGSMGFVVGKVTMGQVHLRVLGIFKQTRPPHLTCCYADYVPEGRLVFNLNDSH
jgi:hypothetical protein